MACEPARAAAKLRVFLVDDEPLVRRGLRLLCDTHPDFEVCGEAETEHEAWERILPLKPDLVVVDLSLKEGSGLSLTQQLREVLPGLKILVFSMHNQTHFAAAAFAAGAHGYVTKDEGAEMVIEAIQSLMAGRYYLSEPIAAQAPNLLPQGRLAVSKRPL